MEKLANFLHTLFCRTKHLMEMEKYGEPEAKHLCSFYLERSIERTWELDDHLKWLDYAENFVTRVGAKNTEEALSILNKLMAVRQAAEGVFEQHPKAREVFFELFS